LSSQETDQAISASPSHSHLQTTVLQQPTPNPHDHNPATSQIGASQQKTIPMSRYSSSTGSDRSPQQFQFVSPGTNADPRAMSQVSPGFIFVIFPLSMFFTALPKPLSHRPVVGISYVISLLFSRSVFPLFSSFSSVLFYSCAMSLYSRAA
jgi:hypothetical protein